MTAWNKGAKGITTKHGQSRGSGKDRAGNQCTSEYRTWQHAKQRCVNPNDQDYHNYGARGITMCDEWMESFEQFYSDMGKRPKDKSLDRIDVDGPYAPWNCRWATKKQQANNKRQRVRVSDLIRAGVVTYEQVEEVRKSL